MDKAAIDNRANQLNPNHEPTGPGRDAGYHGAGTQDDLDNHANQLNPNNREYRGGQVEDSDDDEEDEHRGGMWSENDDYEGGPWASEEGNRGWGGDWRRSEDTDREENVLENSRGDDGKQWEYGEVDGDHYAENADYGENEDSGDGGEGGQGQYEEGGGYEETYHDGRYEGGYDWSEEDYYDADWGGEADEGDYDDNGEGGSCVLV